MILSVHRGGVRSSRGGSGPAGGVGQVQPGGGGQVQPGGGQVQPRGVRSSRGGGSGPAGGGGSAKLGQHRPATWRAVCLLRSRRRTVLFSHIFISHC